MSLLQDSKADTNRVVLLLKLGQHHIFKPGEATADLDSGLILIQQAEQLSQQLHYEKGLGKSYCALSQVYREKGDKEQGLQFVEHAISLLSQNNYQEELGDAYMEKRHYYSIYGTEEESTARIRMAELALASFQKAENSLKQAECLQELGDLYAIIEKFGEAITQLNEALRLFNTVGHERVHGVYDMLGAIYTHLGDSKEGLRYGLLAVKTAEMLQDSSSQLCTIYNRVGMTYYELDKQEQAMVYFQKAMEIAKKNNDLTSVVFLNINITNVLLRLKRPSEALAFHQDIVRQYPAKDPYQRLRQIGNFMSIYQDLGQYEQAQVYCNQVLAMAKEMENKSGYPKYVYNLVLQFLLASGQFNMAQQYLPTFMETAKQSGEPRFLANAHKLYYELDSAQGNYQEALSHYQQYKAWEDTLSNEAKSKQIAQLQIQYETDKKDQEIHLQEQNIELLTQQGSLQQARLDQANFTRNVTFGGVVLLLIIVVLLYNQYQTKQKSNRQLQDLINVKDNLLHEREWLLKEIHHRVKNNLQIVMSLLNTQTAYIENDAALNAIRESQHRMQAMSLIHQKLYQTDNVASIDMHSYIHELVGYLQDSFDLDKSIYLEIDITPVQLDVSQAVPLGLILNEAITNAFKHAFTGKEKGKITIQLQKQSEHWLTLKVTDDGNGLPENFDISRCSSLGINLIQGLSKQLEGHLAIESKDGLQIFVGFPIENMLNNYAQSLPQPSIKVPKTV